MADVWIGPGAVNYDAAAHNPGDTIYLNAGAYTNLSISNAQGTAVSPIVITNTGGKVTLDDNWFYIDTCYHVHITGTGDAGHEYGICVNEVFRIYEESHNIEIDHIESTDRMDIKDDINADFEMTDIRIHHCYCHDVAGNNEAIYIGSSSFDVHPTEYLMRRIEIDNNIFEDCGCEAVQVGSVVEDCEIHDNIFNNVVATCDLADKPAIMVNAGIAGKIYDNIIDECRGPGIYAHSAGGTLEIYRNLLIDTGSKVDSDYDAILIQKNDVYIYNNTIIGADRYGIHLNWGSDQSAINNIVLDTTGTSIVDNTGNAADIHHNHTKEDGYIVATYGFVDPVGDDYRIEPPCDGIDAGVDVGLPYQGTAPDLGAYEYETIPPSVTVHAASALAVDSPCTRIAGRRQ